MEKTGYLNLFLDGQKTLVGRQMQVFHFSINMEDREVNLPVFIFEVIGPKHLTIRDILDHRPQYPIKVL